LAHVGHSTSFPASESGASKSFPQAWQPTRIGMGRLSKNRNEVQESGLGTLPRPAPSISARKPFRHVQVSNFQIEFFNCLVGL
jgi:hypothetical protein